MLISWATPVLLNLLCISVPLWPQEGEEVSENYIPAIGRIFPLKKEKIEKPLLKTLWKPKVELATDRSTDRSVDGPPRHLCQNIWKCGSHMPHSLHMIQDHRSIEPFEKRTGEGGNEKFMNESSRLEGKVSVE